MAKVNWNQIAADAVAGAESRGQEANVTEARNVLNDVASRLVARHEPWEILEGVYRLAGYAFKR